MQKINNAQELTDAIRALEIRQSQDWALLEEQLHVSYESLKPFTFIKNTLSNLTSAPEIKGNMLDTALGMIAGYLSKKAIVGSTRHPLKFLLGTFLQMGVTNVVLNKSAGIKSVLSILVNKVIKKNHNASSPEINGAT